MDRIQRAYGLSIASELPLPELGEAAPGRAQVEVRLARGEAAPPSGDWMHHWELPGGFRWLSCARTDDEYLLRFHGLADFVVSRAGRLVVARPSSGLPDATLRHLLLDSVLPLVLALHGIDAIHAAAVLTPRGACAFVGETGAGKSTLAASFAHDGLPIVSDDCLPLVDVDHDGVPPKIGGGYAGMRLREDAIAALGATREAAVAHYTSKQRVLLGPTPPSPPFVLARVYLLERVAAEEPPRVVPIASREVFVELLSSTFRIDVEDQTMLARQFARLARVASSVPARRLFVPGSLDALPAVRAAVLADAAL